MVQCYGASRLSNELCAQSYHLNSNNSSSKLVPLWMRAKASRKFSPVSYSVHDLPVPENLLEHDFYTKAQNRSGRAISRICVLMKAGCTSGGNRPMTA